MTSDDITTIPSDPNSSTTGANEATALASVQLRRHESPSDERGGRREGGRRNRQSVVVETDMEESGAEVQVKKSSPEEKVSEIHNDIFLAERMQAISCNCPM